MMAAQFLSSSHREGENRVQIGSLGVFVELDAASSKVLSDLERNMRQVVKGVGELKQEECVASF